MTRHWVVPALATVALLAGCGSPAGLTEPAATPEVSSAPTVGADPIAGEPLPPIVIVPGYGGEIPPDTLLVQALRDAGREVVTVDAVGDGTGDLREQARYLDQVVSEQRDAGAEQVDVVGFSAGGLVARWWITVLGGDEHTRRVVTLGTPHRGTGAVFQLRGRDREQCTGGCPQLAPGSEFIRRLNEVALPTEPDWLSTWSTTDSVILPPSSGSLPGAADVPVQQLCGEKEIDHDQLARDPAVLGIVLEALSSDELVEPDKSVCSGP